LLKAAAAGARAGADLAESVAHASRPDRSERKDTLPRARLTGIGRERTLRTPSRTSETTILPSAELQAALDAAEAAARVIRELYQRNLAVVTKADKSPVTEADVRAEQAIHDVLSKRFPSYGFYGEETGRHAMDAESIWLVDPIDGTTLTSKGRGNALAVIALSEKGSMFDPGPCVYMDKLAVGPELVGLCSIELSATENLKAVAKAKRIDIRDVTAVVLDRDRHDDLVAEIREAGARIRLIPDGDVAGAITTAWPDSGADIMFGIGGTPEGVIAAAALKGMGGELQGRLWPRNDEERAAAIAAGYDLKKVLSTDDLVAGDNCFFAATGITDGELLKGVHVSAGFVSTQSLVIRSKTGTVRLMNARHRQN
jgi:fructose-1,6-bisphosphatase II